MTSRNINTKKPIKYVESTFEQENRALMGMPKRIREFIRNECIFEISAVTVYDTYWSLRSQYNISERELCTFIIDGIKQDIQKHTNATWGKDHPQGNNNDLFAKTSRELLHG